MLRLVRGERRALEQERALRAWEAAGAVPAYEELQLALGEDHPAYAAAPKHSDATQT